MLLSARSFGVGLYAPGLDVLHGGVADAVRRVDTELVTVFNRGNQRYEIYDRAAPGGPKWQLVMRVQEPDGSFRPLDGRVIPALYRARRPVSQTIRDIERQEAAHEEWVSRQARRIGEDLSDDVKWLGRRVMGYGGTTVAWQKRTDPEARERIRAEARS